MTTQENVCTVDHKHHFSDNIQYKCLSFVLSSLFSSFLLQFDPLMILLHTCMSFMFPFGVTPDFENSGASLESELGGFKIACM